MTVTLTCVDCCLGWLREHPIFGDGVALQASEAQQPAQRVQAMQAAHGCAAAATPRVQAGAARGGPPASRRRTVGSSRCSHGRRSGGGLVGGGSPLPRARRLREVVQAAHGSRLVPPRVPQLLCVRRCLPHSAWSASGHVRALCESSQSKHQSKHLSATQHPQPASAIRLRNAQTCHRSHRSDMVPARWTILERRQDSGVAAKREAEIKRAAAWVEARCARRLGLL